MTAIEWLEKRFYFTKGQLIDIDFKQAKAMEKEQIRKAYLADAYNPQLGEVRGFHPLSHKRSTNFK